MTVRKIKASWWVDFRANHVRYRKRSPENSRTGAQAFEALLRQSIVRGGPLAATLRRAPVAPRFRDFAWTWFDDYVLVHNKPSEQRSKRVMLRCSIVPYFGAMRVDEISLLDLERYKAQLVRAGLANMTVNNRLAALHKCLTMAYLWLGLEGKPPAVTWLRAAPPKTDFLTHEECGRLLSQTSGILYELVLVGLRTGMRQGELKGLQWSSINWQSLTITVRHSKDDYLPEPSATKSNRERHIPMHRDVYRVLSARRQDAGYVFLNTRGEPFQHWGLSTQLTAASARAGLRRVHWHLLRHTFASHLAMDGVPLGAIQALLGHASVTTTMRYAHLAPSTLRNAIDLLESAPRLENGQSAGNRWHELQTSL